MIVPDTFIHNESYETTRRHLVRTMHVSELLKCTFPVFEDSTVGSAVLVVRRGVPGATRLVESHTPSQILAGAAALEITVPAERILRSSAARFPFMARADMEIVDSLESKATQLGQICDVRDGVNPGPRLFRETIVDPQGPPKPSWRRLLEGENITRYRVSISDRVIDYDPNLLTEALKKQGASFREAWIFQPNKIVTRQTAPRIIAAVDSSNAVGLNSVHHTRPRSGSHYSIWFLLACLNSSIIERYYRLQFQETRSTFPQVHISSLRLLPIPRIDTVVTPIEKAHLDSVSTETLLGPAGSLKPQDLLSLIISQSPSEAAARRACHDVIAYLARERSGQTSDAEAANLETLIEHLLAYLYGVVGQES